MKRVVILGGGFGGVRCALDLSRRSGKSAEIVLIDRASAHVFTPSLYEVASAYRESDGPVSLKLRRSVSIPYNEIFAGTEIRHIQREVTSVDVATQTIYLKDGKEVVYDHCVFGIGSQSTDYGIPGVAQCAYFFKTIDDALRVNIRLHQLFRAYLNGSRERPLQFVLVGAGFTGIELAAEIASCLRKLGYANSIDKKFFSVMVFEAAPQMLPMLSAQERAILMRRLTEIGVGMLDHSPIESVHPDHIKLADGHVWKGDMVIWTAGIQPNQMLSHISGLALTAHGKIDVDEHLRVKNSESLFAMGDAVEFVNKKTQQPVPALAYNAIDQAKVVARNISRAIKGGSLSRYKPKDTIWIVPVGGKFALAHLSASLTISGFWGWVIRYIVDLRYFISILPLSKALKLLRKDLILFSQND